MEQLIDKKRNYSLDLLKLVSSFMVVCIHFRTYGVLGEMSIILARFAVPVFFMVSGYYAYSDNCIRIKRKISNIVRLYVYALVLYFCFNIAVKLLSGQGREAIWYVSTYLRIRYVAPAVLFNESITAMHLWFFGALIYSYVLRYFAVKFKVKDNILLVISCLLLMVHLALGIGLFAIGVELPAFLQKNYIIRNFLFMGFPLFSIGGYIRKKEEALLCRFSGKLVFLFIVLGVSEIFFVHGIDWTKDLYIGSLLLSFALFVLALKMKDKSYNPRLISIFYTSTDVYLIHVMIGEILSRTVLDNMMWYLYLKPVIIFAVSVVLSLLMNKIIYYKMKKALLK